MPGGEGARVKIKCRPEDFRVEELAAVRPQSRGPFGLYRLEKRGLSTFEAIAELARRLGRPPAAISAGGLKDKYALTSQHVTIFGKPAPPLRARGLRLDPLGRAEAPMTGKLLTGNRFAIVLRDLAPGSGAAVRERAALAAAGGLPNYFDEQRFGSLRAGEGFIARRLMDADAQGALRLHLAAPSRLDAPVQRARRRAAAELWGDWDALFARLPRGPDRDAVALLRQRPGDFAGAFARLDRRLVRLYLFAYQSYLWNEILKRLLESAAEVSGGRLLAVRYAAGELLFPERAAPELPGELPLPCAAADYGGGPAAAAAAAVLAAEGLEARSFRLPGMKGLRFRGGRRAALVRPAGLRAGPEAPDELYPGRRKLRLDFELPPGSYATLVVKFAARDMLPGSRASRRAR